LRELSFGIDAKQFVRATGHMGDFLQIVPRPASTVVDAPDPIPQ
jgi:hypothetical protein